MSFSSNVKEELCKLNIHKKCCAVAEAYGILLYCNEFSVNEIHIVTLNSNLAKRLPKLFKKAFGIEFDEQPEQIEDNSSHKYHFRITSVDKIAHIYSDLGYNRNTSYAHHVNFGILEEECCRASFIRGAFLAGGSVTDPEKRYHLEIVTVHYNVRNETKEVLYEMELNAKEAMRSGNYILYFKVSEQIEEFLTKIGAPISAMDVMNAKVEKEMRNSIQRQVNCDTGNVDKTISASKKQIEAIRKLDKEIGIINLPEKLQQVALLRATNPELSLAELADISFPKLSKSCINHRIRKLMEMAHID